jgi:hypothetical protein
MITKARPSTTYVQADTLGDLDAATVQLLKRAATVQSLDRMELVYRYLRGPQFRHRIDAIVERFTDMRDDLDRERKTIIRMWAKREEQLKGLLDSTGDLQGIAGRAMQKIESLHVLMIANNAPETT